MFDYISSLFSPKFSFPLPSSQSLDQQNTQYPLNAQVNKGQFIQFLKTVDELQIAKDNTGNVHPKWQETMQQFNKDNRSKLNQDMKNVSQKLNLVAELCEQQKQRFNADRSVEKDNCIEHMQTLIFNKFERKFYIESMLLGRHANKCLLDQRTVAMCLKQMKDRNERIFQQGLQNLDQILRSKGM